MATKKIGIRDLRRVIAEEGYNIYPVSRLLYRSRSDFVAVPKNGARMFLLAKVYKGKQTRIVVRPYCAGTGIQRLRKKIIDLKLDFCIGWNLKPIPASSRFTIEHYLSPGGREAYSRDFPEQAVLETPPPLAQFSPSAIDKYGEKHHTYAIPPVLRY